MIKILNLKKSSTQLAHDEQAGIYDVTFQIKKVKGMAKLVTSETIKKGSTLSVGTGFEKISEFSVYGDADALPVQISALPTEGDFKIVGKVVFASEDVLSVDVDDFGFTLEVQEINNKPLKEDQMVSFVVHSLWFYDENF
ncbi:MAG: hypothetical protein ACRCYY_13435 [Trueperaceae bacterium]